MICCIFCDTMPTPMELDNVDFTFDDSLELNMSTFKFDDSKMSIESSTPVEIRVEPTETIETSVETPEPATPPKRNTVNTLVVNSENKRKLVQLDEKMDQQMDQQIVKPVHSKLVEIEPITHKIHITIDPDLLLKYLSVVSKLLLMCTCVGLSIAFLYTFYYEVNDELKSQYIEKQAEIQQCYSDYEDNYCNTQRAPKLQDHCQSWEKCMRQDPFKYNTMIVITKVIGKCIDHFIDVLSLKSLFFIITVLLIIAYMRKTPTYIMNLSHPIEQVTDTLKKLK